MKITVDFTEEEISNYLRDKLNIQENILTKLKEEKIDGEALILLRKNDFKKLGIKIKDKNNILNSIEKGITKMKKDIQNDELYAKALNSTSNDPLNYIKANEPQLKLGEKLKYIKYLFVKNKPPNQEKTDELFKYLKKYLIVEDNIINQIIDNIKDILNYSDQRFEEQCQEWEIEDDEQFKLKLIIELIKQNDDNKNNNLQTQNCSLNQILKSGRKLKLKNFNMETTIESLSLEGNYNLYAMIELYNYETSQEDIASGLINPINEFQKLCEDFEIEFQNEGTYIKYDQAFKIKTIPSMLWGTKESLKQFFKDKGINNAISFFENKTRENKAGIYLCINKETLIAFLIVWPGELNYKYSRIEEPNDNILLTLVRYGFSLAPNSILCFTDEEIKEINFEGYEIFKEINSKGFEAERSKIVFNTIKQKSFNIGRKEKVKLNDVKFENKIVGKLMNQNCLLVYEEKENNSLTEDNINNIKDFLQFNSNQDIYFDDNFGYINPIIFYHLIRNNQIYLKDINNEEYFFSKKSLEDAFKRKLNKVIDSLILPIYKSVLKINKNNINEYIICNICKKKKSNDSNDFYYINSGNIMIYFHQDCYFKNNK